MRLTNCMYMKRKNRIMGAGISGKDGFFPSFLSENGARLMLGIRMVSELRWASRHGTLQYSLLQVVEHR